MAGPTVFVKQRLHITPKTIFVEPLNSDGKPLVHEEIITIDRSNYEITLEPNNGQIPSNADTKLIEGIVGIEKLTKGRAYLIVVTRKERVGKKEFCGGDVWVVKETQLIDIQSVPQNLHLNRRQLAANRRYTAMLRKVLSTPYFYFSYNADLSHTRQRLNGLQATAHFSQKSILSRADEQFVWNRKFLAEFLTNFKLQRYALTLVHGYFEIHEVKIEDQKITWGTIARRSKNRVGTRSNVRGLDPEGNSANFIESETIVETSDNEASFVITRGSLPALWKQRANLERKPVPQIAQTGHNQAFKNHIDKQVSLYGNQVIVNLIDKHGSEAGLSATMQNIIDAVSDPKVHYEQIDIHEEFSRLGWELGGQESVNKLQKYQLGYYLKYTKRPLRHTPPQRQTGVFRVNCLDSTDRTNLMQSLLVRQNLKMILEKLMEGKNLRDPSNLFSESFDKLFRKVWVDHGDRLAYQYCGTGALYSDFTRTGTRTKMGAVEDWRRSVIRYYKNNFADGFRQDSMDLFVGNYVVPIDQGETKENKGPLFENKWKTRYMVLPLLLVFSFAMLLITLLSIIPAGLSAEILLSTLIWAGSMTVFGGSILYFGPEFVDPPLLYQIPNSQR